MTRDELLAELAAERYAPRPQPHANRLTGCQQMWELAQGGEDEHLPLRLVQHERRSA